MNLKQLKYFLAVSQEGQITAAAERLHIAQPPLSYQIKQLELELGVQLFKRLPQGVQLTDAGELLATYAEQLTQLSTTAVNKVQALGKGISGHLNLGLVSSSAGVIPNQALTKMLKKYPTLSLDVYEANTYNLLEQLQKHMLDVAIMRTPFNAQGLTCRYFASERMTAVIPQRLAAPFQNRRQLHLTDLGQLPLIKYRRFDNLFAGTFDQHNLTIDFRLTCDDARTAVHWANQQMGVALVPHSLAETYQGERVILRSIAEPSWETRLALAWPTSDTLSPSLKAFIQQFPLAETIKKKTS